MAQYYKSKGDKAMTQLSEAYGQIVQEQQIISERTISSYRGGTERQVVQEIAPLIAGAARVAPILARGAAKLAPKIVKGAKALMPGAKAAAKQVGKAAVAGAAQGVQQRVQGAVAGQPQPQQEQEEEFSVGSFVEVDDETDDWSGEIVGVVAERPDHFWVHDDADLKEVAKQVHRDYLKISKTIADEEINIDDEPDYTGTAGRVDKNINRDI